MSIDINSYALNVLSESNPINRYPPNPYNLTFTVFNLVRYSLVFSPFDISYADYSN